MFTNLRTIVMTCLKIAILKNVLSYDLLIANKSITCTFVLLSELLNLFCCISTSKNLFHFLSSYLFFILSFNFYVCFYFNNILTCELMKTINDLKTELEFDYIIGLSCYAGIWMPTPRYSIYQAETLPLS